MPRMEIIMRIDEIWQNIISHEGETFYTAKGLPFTYVVINDHEIVPYRGKERLFKIVCGFCGFFSSKNQKPQTI